MTKKRFGMYRNILYDDGDILNPFDTMKLLNYFDKENTQIKKENNELKERLNQLSDENEKIKGKVDRLLNFVEIKQCVTRTEIRKWWND